MMWLWSWKQNFPTPFGVQSTVNITFSSLALSLIASEEAILLVEIVFSPSLHNDFGVIGKQNT